MNRWTSLIANNIKFVRRIIARDCCDSQYQRIGSFKFLGGLERVFYNRVFYELIEILYICISPVQSYA